MGKVERYLNVVAMIASIFMVVFSVGSFWYSFDGRFNWPSFVSSCFYVFFAVVYFALIATGHFRAFVHETLPFLETNKGIGFFLLYFGLIGLGFRNLLGIIGSSVILACSATFLFAGFFRPEIPAPSTPFFRVELLFCNDGSAGDEDFVKNVNDQSQSADEGAHQNIGSQAPSEPVEQIA